MEAEEQKDVAQATESSQTFTVDANKSGLTWIGFKLASQHDGTVDIENGELNVENGNITAGNFTIDMQSITVLDLTDEKSNAKLTSHLKDPDFFNVDTFPTAKFEISSIEAMEADEEGNTHKVTGNLTLLDQTRSITFPAKISVSENEVTADAVFTINRLDWGIEYNSTSVFKNVADDYVVKDDFQMGVKLVATK